MKISADQGGCEFPCLGFPFAPSLLHSVTSLFLSAVISISLIFCILRQHFEVNSCKALRRYF